MTFSWSLPGRQVMQICQRFGSLEDLVERRPVTPRGPGLQGLSLVTQTPGRIQKGDPLMGVPIKYPFVVSGLQIRGSAF